MQLAVLMQKKPAAFISDEKNMESRLIDSFLNRRTARAQMFEIK